MSVDKVTAVFALIVRSIGACGALDLTERNIEVGGGSLSLLVALAYKFHFLGRFHAWLNVHGNLSLLGLKSTAIQAENLLLVADSLARAVVQLLKRHVYSHINVTGGLRCGLFKSTIGRTEVTALDFKVGASHLCQVRAQVEEGVRLQEELVKDFVAVLLVLVAATEHTIGAFDAKTEPLVTILLEDGAQLLVGEHFVSLTDQVELGEVETHLGRVLEWVVLQSILLKANVNREMLAIIDLILTQC